MIPMDVYRIVACETRLESNSDDVSLVWYRETTAALNELRAQALARLNGAHVVSVSHEVNSTRSRLRVTVRGHSTRERTGLT